MNDTSPLPVMIYDEGSTAGPDTNQATNIPWSWVRPRRQNPTPIGPPNYRKGFIGKKKGRKYITLIASEIANPSNTREVRLPYHHSSSLSQRTYSAGHPMAMSRHK
jgi:hypothetical protein